MHVFRAYSVLRARLLPPATQAVYLILVSIIIYAFRSQWAYDDPFITYRYAQNLAQGSGFVYNPPERILSTTSPFFTLLLAFIRILWHNLPQAANLISSICLSWGGLLLWKLGRLWKIPPVSWLGASLYPTFPLLLNTVGSEMPLFLAFCLAAATFYTQKRYSLWAIFSGLATLTRPDGILLAVTLSLDFIAQNHSSPLLTRLLRKPALLIASLILPWLLFAWVYFGSPIPATLATKQHQASMEISQTFFSGFANQVRRLTGSGDLFRNGSIILEALLAMIGFPAAFLISRRWASPATWLPVLSWPVLHFLSYSALGVSGYFWYYAPLVPGFLIASGIGIFTFQRFLAVRRPCLPTPDNLNPTPEKPPQNTSASTRLSTMLILLCVVLALGQAQSLVTGRRLSDPRYLIYRATGEWLHKNTSVGAHIGALEIGIIGYYAQRNMIDFAGLLQPEVALQLKPGNTYQDAALWTIDHYRPEFVVLHRDLFPLVEQMVTQRCILAQEFPGSSYLYSGNLDIYHCPKP